MEKETKTRIRVKHIKPTTAYEVETMWNVPLDYRLRRKFERTPIFIGCSAEGAINWSIGKVYTLEEIKKFKNINIIL